MNDDRLNKQSSEPEFLDFTEVKEPNSEDNIIDESDADRISFSPKDFEILARKASGFQLDEEEQFVQKEDEERTLEEKVGLRGLSRPYQKILVGIFLTSFVLVCLLLLRGSWLKIMNLSQPNLPTKKSFVDRRQQEIDRLKAELATIEQNTKPIKHEPEPKPIPEPKAEPIPKPKAEPIPKPEPELIEEPEPEPIDPYKQWELLSQLGTLGSSDIDRKTAQGGQKTVPKRNKEDIKRIVPSSTANNRVATVSLSKNLGLGQPKYSSSTFSADAKNIILNGLGVSQTQRTSKIASSRNDNSRQVSIADGILTTSIPY
jgi:outer membrane biosynthesis protein TonB